MLKLNEKKDAIWDAIFQDFEKLGVRLGQAGGHRGGSLTDLRSDQEQEFQENFNTACARGAPDSVRFAMPAGH